MKVILKQSKRLGLILLGALLGCIAWADSTTMRLTDGRYWTVGEDGSSTVSASAPVVTPKYEWAWNVAYSKELKRFSLETAATVEWKTFHNAFGRKGLDIEVRAIGALNVETGLPNGGVWFVWRKPIADEATLLIGPKVVIESDNTVGGGLMVGVGLKF